MTDNEKVLWKALKKASVVLGAAAASSPSQLVREQRTKLYEEVKAVLDKTKELA